MATKKSSFAKTGTCYTWSILGQESRYTLKPSKKYTPGALRLASLTSYQLFGGKVASYTWIYLRCLAFNRFCLKIELIRGHTLLFLYPLHERHHLRARGVPVELNAIDCSSTDLMLVTQSSTPSPVTKAQSSVLSLTLLGRSRHADAGMVVG